MKYLIVFANDEEKKMVAKWVSVDEYPNEGNYKEGSLGDNTINCSVWDHNKKKAVSITNYSEMFTKAHGYVRNEASNG